MPPRVFRALVPMALVCSLFLSNRSSPGGESGPLPWRDDFSRAQEEARARNRPLWVQFTGQWCGYCRRMESETFVHPEIVALARDRFVPVRVQSDENEELVARFEPSGLPATFLLDPSGRVIAQQEGFADARSFRQFLDRALTRLGRATPRVEEASRSPLALVPSSLSTKSGLSLASNRPEIPGAGRGDERGTQARVALGGLCPVTLIREHRQVPGRRSLALRRGEEEYWFASEASRAAFREQPEAFLPAEGGRCVVSRLDAGRSCPGQVRFGLVYEDRIYLCADAAARDRFAQDPGRYTDFDVADRGYCPHCRNQTGKLVRGSPRFALQHDGRRYYFPDAQHLAAFRASPEKYVR